MDGTGVTQVRRQAGLLCLHPLSCHGIEVRELASAPVRPRDLAVAVNALHEAIPNGLLWHGAQLSRHDSETGKLLRLMKPTLELLIAHLGVRGLFVLRLTR